MTILFACAAFIILMFVGCYNGLIAALEAVRNNEKQIDIQLDRRFKVFESLINTVKKYTDYEHGVLTEVVSLRNQAQQAQANQDPAARHNAEDAISKVASNLNVTFENYPTLKANEEFLKLQEEIVNTENKLSYAKQAYNDSIERYNVRKNSLLQSMVVALFPSKLNATFKYWQLTEASIAEHENYTVKF